MAGKRKFSDDTETVVVDMYRRGDRVADIASATGVSPGSVYGVLRRAGLSPDRQRHTRATSPGGATRDRVARLEDALDFARSRLDEASLAELRRILGETSQ